MTIAEMLLELRDAIQDLQVRLEKIERRLGIQTPKSPEPKREKAHA